MPIGFLTQVQGYRPLQANWVTLEIASLQLILLPATALLLDNRWAEPRMVSFIGLALMLTSCIGSSFSDYRWNRDQFYVWQLFQAMGQPAVVLPLLMFSTNTVKDPKNGPFTSSMVNFPRGFAEIVGAWLIDLIDHWRGSLHYDRIVDQIGQDRLRTIQGPGI